MQAFMNGDNEAAIAHWKNAVSVAVETNAKPAADLAELYYCLGKALSDLRRDNEAVGYLRTGVDMLLQCSPGDQRVKVAQFELAEVLNRTGGHEEADRQFKQAYDLPEHVNTPTIPLKDAIRELQKLKFVNQLKGGVLSNLCHELGIDPAGDNADIGELLVSYYIDEKHWVKRQVDDKFYVEDYTNFETESVLGRLCHLADKPDFLVLEDQKGDTRDGDTITLTMRRSDGELVYRASTSVVGIVSEFNNQLGILGEPRRFCSLDLNSCFAAYFIDMKTYDYLNEKYVLQFDGFGE